MRPPNRKPTETSLRTTYERDELLGQEAHSSRAARWVRTIARVAFVLLVVGVVAAIVVGPGQAINWIVTDLLPMVVLLGVVFGVVGLMMWEGGKVHDERYEQQSTNSREPRRGEGRGNPLPRAGVNSVGRGGRAVGKTDDGISSPVYWLLVCLFVLASAAMACFFGLVIYDQWINDRELVAGRFDQGESLRVIFLLLAAVAVMSGLLWRQYRKVDSYGSPLGLFFAVVFALCGALAMVTALPAVFAG